MNKNYLWWLGLLCFVCITNLDAQLPSTDQFETPYESFRNAERIFYAEGMKGGANEFRKAAEEYKRKGSTDGYIAAKAMEGLVLVNTNELQESFVIFKQPEEIFDELRNPNKSTVAYLTMCIGKYHLYHSEYSHAMTFLEKSLETSDTYPEAVSPVFIIELKKTLGELYLKKGEKRRAINLYESVIDATMQLPSDEIRYDSLGQQKILVADLYYELRDVEIAIERYKEILAQRNLYLRHNPKKEGEFLYKIGRAHFNHHEYDTAHMYLTEALGFRLTSLNTADAQTMLASVAMNVRDYEEALVKNGSAVSILSRIRPPAQFFYNVLMKQGNICKAIGPNDQVVEWYKKALVPPPNGTWSIAQELNKYELKPINHPTRPEINDNFNIALLNYDHAERLIPLLAKSRQAVYQVEVDMAKGSLYYEAKDYKGARQYYESSLEKMKDIYPEDHPLVAEASRAMAEIYTQEKEYGKALEFVDKAIASAMGATGTFDANGMPDIENAAHPYELLYGMSAKASLLYHIALEEPTEENFLKALEILEISMKLLNKLRKTHRTEGAKYKISELSEHIGHQALEICSSLYKLTQKKKYVNKSFDYSETSKSSILLQTILQMQAQKVANVPDSVIQQEHKLKVDMSYLNGEIYYELKLGKNANEARLEELRGRLATAKANHKSYLAYLQKNYIEYYTLKYYYKTVSSKELQGTLASDELMLNYVVVDSVIHILVIDKDSIEHIVVPTVDRLHLIIKRYLAAMGGQKTKAFIRYGNVFYEALVKPIYKYIKGRRLIIIPDGELNYLPFEILPSEKLKANEEISYKQMPYLLRQSPVTYNYSATLYLAAKSQDYTKTKSEFIGLAPNFESMDSVQMKKHQNKYTNLMLEPLKFTAVEVQKIAEITKGKTLIGAEATETAFKRDINQYGVLHFATHGLLNNTNPLYSSLALVGDNDEDGMLHTYELYNMNVNAELVVLSACNTGVGKIHKGEGAMSLARGFAYAGCYNVAMTLWPVSDQPTQIIMSDFYQYLIEGYNKDEALQKAKLNFLDNSNGLVTAPLYWGGLIMVGTPDVVHSLKKMAPASNLWLWGAIGGGSLLLVIILVIIGKVIKSKKQRA
ncbi:MAG: CHAT domain-containing protein [Aureispira sp.]|nr:CHAT domain-containing protein [Aureispira sp.]